MALRRHVMRLWKGACFVAVVLLITLGLTETALRLWVPLTALVDPVSLYPKVWYLEHVDEVRARGQHPTHVSDATLGWTYAPGLAQGELSTNSRGMRGSREYAIERRPGVRRGMVLGDSFSAGYGVADEATYAAQLESMLEDTEILNLAVPGYGVDQAILRWELAGRPYQPDFIVLGIFVPDFHRNVGTWWFDAPKPRFRIEDGALTLPPQKLPAMEDTVGNEQRIREELAPLLQNPRIWLAVRYVAERLARRFNGWREPEATFAEKRELLAGLISRLANDCRDRDIDLAIVTILTEYPEYPDEDRILAVIDAAAAASQVPVLHLDRFLGAETRVFDPQTDHWSPLGHRLAAARIADFLNAANVIEN